MVNYQKMYATMFNAATDVIHILREKSEVNRGDILQCIAILSAAQIACEEMYINAEVD